MDDVLWFKKNTALHNVVLFQVFPQNSLSVGYREKKMDSLY